MTDKEFDNLIRDALNSEDVPSDVNKKLIDKLQKKKKAKIISFVRSASAVAAVFICAVAVLSHYNSDMPVPEVDTTKKESVAADTKAPEEAQVVTETAEVEDEKPVQPAKAPSVKEAIAPEAPSVASVTEDSAPATDSTAEFSLAEETDEPAPATENTPMAFSKSRMASPALSSLFREGYDYKAVINEKISAQIAIMDFPEPIVFTGITGDERFTLSEENTLTIIFPEGEIVSAEHGEQFFTVGIIEDGVLR